jgi:transposase-like protein
MKACHHANREELEGFVVAAVPEGATVNTDEWKAYDHLAEKGHPHPTVNHSAKPREWARDDDGDGIREVHSNTIEGIWTGLRNFLRVFRGVNKVYLQQYIAVFVWTHNLKKITADFLQSLFTAPGRAASA